MTSGGQSHQLQPSTRKVLVSATGANQPRMGVSGVAAADGFILNNDGTPYEFDVPPNQLNGATAGVTLFFICVAAETATVSILELE